ncbi:hypothetical protein [Papillibacter cinnamivorans]|uniref:Uncharacterized protein n=1 Tax=Papillibacter cinnamivorans DSM 12816 TaxID=1122930 RepID=A0A1W1YRN2_9FIRM|nr:hypothetical protein [Papillibacter cinnamivorans]SMC38378.1 hypothetical protein SAMN02745168_0623 [Papillibacter cinnamivorans DSM 12816]
MTTPDRLLQVLILLLGIGSAWGLVKLAEDIMGLWRGDDRE